MRGKSNFKGAQAVAQVLTHNNTIEHLDLSANSCGLGMIISLIVRRFLYRAKSKKQFYFSSLGFETQFHGF
jgi:hypothetical protein